MPGRRCAVLDCKVEDISGCGTSFFSFPLKNPELLSAWLTNIKREKWIPTKSNFLCSNHFTADCYTEKGKIKRLKKNAVPTLFSQPKSEYTMQQNVEINEYACGFCSEAVNAPKMCTQCKYISCCQCFTDWFRKNTEEAKDFACPHCSSLLTEESLVKVLGISDMEKILTCFKNTVNQNIVDFTTFKTECSLVLDRIIQYYNLIQCTPETQNLKAKIITDIEDSETNIEVQLILFQGIYEKICKVIEQDFEVAKYESKRQVAETKRKKEQEIEDTPEEMELDADDYSCSLCFEDLKSPRMCVECRYRACANCFSDWFKRNRELDRPTTCPQCAIQLTDECLVKVPGLIDMEKKLRALKAVIDEENTKFTKVVKDVDSKFDLVIQNSISLKCTEDTAANYKENVITYTTNVKGTIIDGLKTFLSMYETLNKAMNGETDEKSQTQQPTEEDNTLKPPQPEDQHPAPGKAEKKTFTFMHNNPY